MIVMYTASIFNYYENINGNLIVYNSLSEILACIHADVVADSKSLIETLKSSCSFFADYIFTDAMIPMLESWKNLYDYQFIQIHFDGTPDACYHQFIERNRKTALKTGTREINISLNEFKKRTQQNVDFRWGDKFFLVNTTEVSIASYEEILQCLISSMGPEISNRL